MFNRCFAIVLGAMLSVSVALADAGSPVTMLKGVANGMIAQLEKNKSRLKQANVIYDIVDKELIPNIALDYMGMSVVGRNHWKQATAQQQQAFISAFTKLVTSTYSAALASYNGDKVKFYPLRQDFSKARIISVRSVIVRRNGQKIPVTYNLVRANGRWLIYDFSIENVSITRSYNAQFADILSKQGMDGLLAKLQKHNRKTQ